jgi:hypothetical protein
MALEARLSLDTALVPERVFWAINLTYEAERVRPKGFVGFDVNLDEVDPVDPAAVTIVRTPAERESTIGISGAVAFQAVPNLFVGAEARYLRQYAGLDFEAVEGHALYLGPTLFVKVSDHVSLSAAWNVQVAGKAHDEPGHLDLENVEQHQAKLKRHRLPSRDHDSGIGRDRGTGNDAAGLDRRERDLHDPDAASARPASYRQGSHRLLGRRLTAVVDGSGEDRCGGSRVRVMGMTLRVPS